MKLFQRFYSEYVRSKGSAIDQLIQFPSGISGYLLNIGEKFDKIRSEHHCQDKNSMDN